MIEPLANETTVEQLHNEINALDVRIKKIKKQIELSTTEQEIKDQMTDFLLMAEREVASLQNELINLERVRKQLADFFCEDTNSFKIEECFRIFHGFYCKFRQAIAENERRRIQEEQANARRRQREELLATKRRQMESLAATADSEEPFIDMQIYDTRACYSAKKNRKYGNGSGMSEDETSITGSPLLSRRRLGSFNGNGGGDSIISGKEEKSPDITPNGSLRRRRSRVLSEEDEGNLMDFLRSSGNETRERKSWGSLDITPNGSLRRRRSRVLSEEDEGNLMDFLRSSGNETRERKSWGSLDRSWARKARGSGPRKRPSLLSADFSSDRERPSSPSPLTETKSILSAPEEETKPKELHQKIESWLQANERDINDEQKRQNRRLTNRRSLEMDSESERSVTLDTLPEGKQVYSGSQSNYRKVYPPWQPSTTLDNTDVVGAMEAVEDVQPPTIKDKSAWRKSNLNVSNTTEETNSSNIRGRHTIPRTQRPDYLHSIQEDNTDRKYLISSLGERAPTDKLTLYIRSPGDPKEPTYPERKSNIGHTSQPSRVMSQNSLDSSTNSNKVEIDQDNIETPPATRRIFTPTPVDKREPVQPSPCKRIVAAKNRENEDLENNVTFGDGQFDRFSAARRTRRYKRNPENSETLSPTDPNESQPKIEISSPVSNDNEEEEKVARLKSWQDKLKTQSDYDANNSRLSKRLRNISRINQSDVELASQLNNSNLNKVSSAYIGQSKTKVESCKIDIPSQKTKEHDNDEGFEETQSLMSESPSQGASSGGGNYETDAADSTPIVITDLNSQPLRAILAEPSKGGLPRKSNDTPIQNVRAISRIKPSNLQKPMTNTRGVLERSVSLRDRQPEPLRKSTIPRRSESIRKSSSKSSINNDKSIGIQKSNSRNSIVSSRSSLNSATSTSTVKRYPISKPNSVTNNTKPLIHRSNSRTNTTPPTSTKSNLIRRTPSIGGSSTVNTTKPPRPQAMSFMKPTASSTTKSNTTTVKTSPSFRGRM